MRIAFAGGNFRGVGHFEKSESMNALVKKEIRLLLPGFLIGVALTFGNVALNEQAHLEFNFNTLAILVSCIACPALAVFVALNSFGAEISAGTFSMLLAQPVSRRRIWRMKTGLLAAALVIGGLFWCVILYWRLAVLNHPKGMGDFREALLGVWLFLLVIYSGALWTVLLFRQVAAAFWFTLLTPGAIVVLITGLWPEKFADAEEPAVIAALLIYSVAGFWFARRLFLRAQDVAWTGGTIALPEMRGLARFKIGSGIRRLSRPRAALQVKEFQLHQAQFIMAGALALLHIGVLATRKFGSFQRNSSTEFVLEIFWGLWLVMPLLVGCAAAAEERKLGTLEGQLCLPVRRRTQFASKASVVLLLSLLFGVAMPLLLEGTRILPNVHFIPNSFHFENGNWQWMNTWLNFFWYCLMVVNSLAPLLILSGIAATIGLISFYASTLARNTLQALAPAVLGLLLTWFLIFANAVPDAFGFHLPWRGSLIFFIGVPVLAATLLALASWNFQRVFIGGQVWRRNLLVLLAMLGLVAVATAAIYHRAWEKLTPFEPPHGAARLSLSNPATLREQWNTLSVRLPDGRIWTDDYTLNIVAPNPLALLLGDIRLTNQGDSGHYYDGSNWVNVVGNPWRELAGIKADGTLWVSEKPAHRERLAGGGYKMSRAGDLVRFGGETNWSSIAMQNLFLLLVKNDGTLWRWGATNWNYKTHNQWPGLRSFTPYRLGTESNWAETFLADNQPCLRKTDGSVWTTWNSGDTNRQTVKLEPGFRIERALLLEHGGQWRSTTRIWSGLSYRLGVRDNGTFRIRAEENSNNRSRSYEWTAADLQFGKGTNWLAVAGRGEKVVTLKDDGTLWLWPFNHDWRRGWYTDREEREMLDVNPVRLGTHSDWIGVASTFGGIVSLAADGSLWYWPLAGNVAEFMSGIGGNIYWDSDSNTYFQPWLDISRKPQPLGNIFGKAD
jgi:ABC-type transport system involved in multi-copper enzyme maturation permease subunit/alpha-tubulin suppressor-like RCC1 family protein